MIANRTDIRDHMVPDRLRTVVEGDQRQRIPGVVKRMDMHCHSIVSLDTLRFIGFRALLEPKACYDLAKSRGMDYVTLTDHDTIEGCLELLNRYDLNDFIIGEEVSVRFPDDGMVVHVNVYDIDEQQHREIQELASNVYELVPYLKSIGKLFVLNHMGWNEESVPLTHSRIEELVRLFDVFEVLNGSRDFLSNQVVWEAIRGLGKSMVAGSDSHTDRVGQAYTISVGDSPAEYLKNIALGQFAVAGEMGSTGTLLHDIQMLIGHNINILTTENDQRWFRMVARASGVVCRAVCRVPAFFYMRKQQQLSEYHLEQALALTK